MYPNHDSKNPDKTRDEKEHVVEYEEIIIGDDEEIEVDEDAEIEYVYDDSEEYEIDDENDDIEFVNVPPPPFVMPPNFQPPPFVGRPQYPFSHQPLFNEQDGEYNFIDEPKPSKPDIERASTLVLSSAPSLKSMITSQAQSLEKTGEELSVKIKSGESTDVFINVFKLLGSICVIALMFGGIYFGVATFMKNLSAENISKSTQESGFIKGWRLGETRANRIVRIFYEALGDVSKTAAFSDILLKGTVKMNGKEEPFYCIKRASGRSFIRIGNENAERAYFIDTISEGVFKLLDGRTTGRHLKLSERESLAMRSIVAFDELLFKRSFGEVEQGSYVEPMSYAGFENVRGSNFELISAQEDKFEIRYAFEPKTGLLGAASFNIDGKKYLTTFSNYEENEGLKYPLKKEIFIDGKLFATVTTEFLIRNKGFLFP